MAERTRIVSRLLLWSALSAALAAGTAVANAQEQRNGGRVELEEIVVTGSRLRVSDIEGPSPVTVFDRAQIDELGVTSVPELLRYLPQQPYNRSDFYRNDGAQFVELRGLGADTTLVLINGRRTVPSASSVSVNAFDLNSIPVAAVDRIEVLSDAASAVYGADAVGGVVNIVLKREITEPVVDVRYGAAAGGAEEQQLSLSVGHGGDRLRMSATLDYLKKDVLLGEERDRWRNQDYRRFGSVDQRSINSNPGNVTSRTADNLPGLPSRFAAVPEGSTGIGLTPDDFAATAGTRNMESLARYDDIVPEVQRVSAALFGELEVRPNTMLFAEGLYASRDLESPRSPPSLSGTLVPASNAFNPFGVPVSANFIVEGVGSRVGNVENELVRGVLGMRGPLHTWDWEVAVMATQEEASSWVEGSLNSARVAQSLASPDPEQALNVFQDGPGGSPALLSSLLATPTVAEFASDGMNANGFLRGSLGSLPAGSVDVVVGGEWRRDDMRYDSFLFVEADRDANAGFAEVNVPLVSPGMQWPGVHRMSLRLAGRYDDYTDFGSSSNPQYGFTWEPVQSLTLRASYGTSFRPPSLYELYAPRTEVPLPVNDPARNGELVEATAINGGNPELLPVEGESLSAGFVWTPSFAADLRLTASWWQIELDQRVSFVPYQLILAYEDLFADRVERAPPSPADMAAGLPGQLLTVDISRINYGRIDTSGIDASASCAFDTPVGQWHGTVSATWVKEYASNNLPDSPPTQRVGIASVFGTIPRWQANANLSWTRAAWSAGLTGRFTASYDDAVGIDATSNGRRIPSQALVDAQLVWNSDERVDAKSAWWSGLKVTIGAINVLDEEPAFAEIGDTWGMDPSQADLRQRFGYIHLSKRF